LFVWVSNHSSGASWPIFLKFWLGNSVELRDWSKIKSWVVWVGRRTGMFWLAFEVFSWVGPLLLEKIGKIFIYDQAQVNGGINYPEQRWVLKLVLNSSIVRSYNFFVLNLYIKHQFCRPTQTYTDLHRPTLTYTDLHRPTQTYILI